MKIDKAIYNYVWAYAPIPAEPRAAAVGPKKKNRRVEPALDARDKPSDDDNRGKKLSIKI